MNKNYTEASVEVLDILEHMSDVNISKVSKKFIDFLKENASKEYKCNLDYSKALNDMELKKETRGLLALMYKQYWCPEDEKQALQNKFSENEQKHQTKLREKYNPDNIFRQVKLKEEVNQEKNIAVIPKEKWYQKFFIFIKKLFRSK